MASSDPATTHRAFEEGYAGHVFPREVNAAQISDAYRRMLGELFPGGELRHILGHSDFDVAVHVVRARGPAGSSRRRLQGTAMVCAAAMNALSSRAMKLLFERILFHSCPDRWAGDFDGLVAPLDPDNFYEAVLATGTIPLYMLDT